MAEGSNPGIELNKLLEALEQLKRKHPLAERELNRMNEVDNGSHIISSSNAEAEGDTSVGGLRSTNLGLQRGQDGFSGAADASNINSENIDQKNAEES